MSNDPVPSPTSDPGDVRPRRTLERAPSARYGRAGDATPPPAGADALRGGRAALLVAAIGSAAIIVLNVALAITTGLVAIAAATGYLVGGTLRGVGDRIPPAAIGAGAMGSSRGRGIALAMALAVGSVVVGALGTWLISITVQGGSLGPLDYLVEAMGVLLPVQVLIAAGAAWLGSR